MVLLSDQDRSLWNRDEILEGQAIVRECLRRNRPGPYQIQAAINAVHSDAATAPQTDWSQIVLLYDQLVMMTKAPIVKLNRAIAVAETGRVADALALIDALALSSYHLFHATRGDLLKRLGRSAEARAAYEKAASLATNAAEQRFLKERIGLLSEAVN